MRHLPIAPIALSSDQIHLKSNTMRIITTLSIIMSISMYSCSEDTSTEEAAKSETTETTVDKPAPAAPQAMLIDGKWEANYIMNAPKSMDELYPEAKPIITINSEKGLAGGNSGCNNFRGSVEVDGNTLSWGDLVSTRKMCPDMEGETLFLETLKKARTYSVTDNGQTLNLILGDLGIMRLTRVY